MLIKTLVWTFVGICLLSSHIALSAEHSQNLKYAITNRYNVGGEGGWDLLTYDTKRHRLFISRSSHVQVIDADSGKVIGDIPSTEGVHGIALADDLNLGCWRAFKTTQVRALCDYPE